MTMRTEQALVDFHVHSAVIAAQRAGIILEFGTFVRRLRQRNRAAHIHSSYVLNRLIREVAGTGVAIEFRSIEDE